MIFNLIFKLLAKTCNHAISEIDIARSFKFDLLIEDDE